MVMLARKVAEREKGEAPLSIGTSLALESLGGFGEFPNESPPIHKHDELWVNLRTLFRNCFNAIERTVRTELMATDLVNGLIDDIQVLLSTIELRSVGRMNVIFYLNSFKSFTKEFPNGKWRELSTPKQIFEHDLEEKTLKLFMKDFQESIGVDVKEFNVKITAKSGNAVILTHYPTDLLWRSSFQQLTLLESHTGALKSRAEWYTKLTGGKRYNRIPFNRMTMQVFGDGNLLFSSMSPKIKNRILEIAESDDWTPVTTDEKVRHSINKLYDPREKVFFLGLLKH